MHGKSQSAVFVFTSILYTDITDFNNVVCDLHNVDHTKWYKLYVYLGLHKPRLDIISRKMDGDPENCFKECMHAWLNGKSNDVKVTGGHSWSLLASALEEFEENDIATNIRRKYNC